MDLALTIEQGQELLSALQIQLTEMRRELAHTDDRAYRADLRESFDRLEQVERKLADLLRVPHQIPAP